MHRCPWSRTGSNNEHKDQIIMKKIICTLLILTCSGLFAQSDILKKMSNTICEGSGYLIPNKPNDYHIPKGTRVKFTLTVLNEGREEYKLHKDTYLTCTYLDKGKEASFPVRIEAFKQSDIIATKLKALISRKDRAQNMKNPEAAKYGVMLYGSKGVKDKVALLKHLEKEINILTKSKEAAASFDKDHTIKPGANLIFSASGFLPETGKEKPQSHVNLNVKVISSEGKYISVPIKAIFF